MKAIVLEQFEYDGRTIEPGIVEISNAELRSMSFFGRIRPATSTEVQESKLERAESQQPRQTAQRKR